MVRLYCSAYCVRGFLAACPNNRMGRKTDQSTDLVRGGVRIPWKGFGKLVDPSWLRKGVLNKVLKTNVLPPKRGSARNCSSTSCSTGLVNIPNPPRILDLRAPPDKLRSIPSLAEV